VSSAREKRRAGGAKIECVPVPVRSGRTSPSSITRRMRERYCCSSCGIECSALPIVQYDGKFKCGDSELELATQGIECLDVKPPLQVNPLGFLYVLSR
jgi:hypothetical protein